MNAKALFIPVLMCFTCFLFSEGQDGGLISGPDWGILVSAPAGWVRDVQAIPPRGVEALFRKAGERYSLFGLSISVIPQEKVQGGPGSLAEYTKAEKAALVAADPDLVLRELASYSPGLDYSFALRELDEPGRAYYQTIAYYEGPRAFFAFVLSCRSSEEREREKAALFELLDSFVYLSKE